MATSKATHVKTLIIGGGITGLATAWALQEQGQEDYLVLEAKPTPGGLCATTFLRGYYFDYGGHFFHLHTPLGKRLVKKLLGKNLQKHTRRAFVYTNGMKVPVPFQYNLWALSPELRKLAVAELQQPHPPFTPAANFEEWCLQHFGCTLYEAFFRPYNEKLWGRNLKELTTQWCTPFVPAPDRKTILASAFKKPTAKLGYNATFYYPKQGGCGAIIDSLVSRVKHLRTNAPLTRLDITRKTAWVNGERITYEHLVNTIALPQLIHFIDGQAALKKAAAQLEAQSVTVYHLAIARKIEPFHWIYCPDWAQPFYRIGMPNAIAPDCVAREQNTLFSMELPGLCPPTDETKKKIWDGLYQKGWVDRDDKPVFSAYQAIPCAYVIFNQKRAKAVPYLLDELEKHGCYGAGRYGRWEYSFMESSLVQAVELAKKLAS